MLKCFRWLLPLVLLTSLPSHAQNFTLSIGHVLEPQHSVHVGALRFQQVAEEKSGGRIKVNLFPSGMIGDSRELALQVKSGAIFGVIDASTKFVNFVPEFALLDMPFLAKDATSAFAIMDSAAAQDIIYRKSTSAGFRPIHGWEVAFRNIYTKRKAVNAIGDLKGLKIRTIPSPTYINLFKALGASPTPMNFGELYTSLEQGVVDGAENDLLTYLSSKHFEVAPFLAITKHMMLVNTFFVSERIWGTLPADIREILQAASLEARKAAMADSDQRLKTALDELRAKKIQVVEPDLKPFVAAASQTSSYFVDKFGAELVQKISQSGAM